MGAAGSRCGSVTVIVMRKAASMVDSKGMATIWTTTFVRRTRRRRLGRLRPLMMIMMTW